MQFITYFNNILSQRFKNMPKIGKWSEKPASWIDRVYLQAGNSHLRKSINALNARALFLCFFPAFAFVDFFTALGMSLFYKLNMFFTSGDKKTRYEKKHDEYLDLSLKNLFGFLAFPLGLIFPKLVTLNFNPAIKSKEEIVSGGKLYKQQAHIVTPQNETDIKNTILDAAKNNQKITIVGAGQSQGKQFLSNHCNNIVLKMDNFKNIRISPDSKTATVGAGATWGDLQIIANQHQLAIKIMQASNVFSIGGSLSTNIHGWNKAGTLANIVKKLKIIDASGQIQTLTPRDELFGYVLGGYSQFGVIIEAKIELTENETLVERSIKVKPNVYIDYFRANVQNNVEKRMHLYRLSISPDNLLGEGVAVNYTADHETTIEAAENYHQESKKGSRLDRILSNVARHFGWARKLYWQYESRRLLNNETTLTTNDIMHPSINAMFHHARSETEWLQEYFIPGDNLEFFLKEMGVLLSKNDVPLINATVRYVPEDKISKLSYANGGDRFALVLCFNQSLRAEDIIKAKKWIQQSIDIALKHDGTYYLPYQQFASKSQFDQAYPTAGDVTKMKEKHDPKNIFNSGFSDQYLSKTNQKINYYQNILSTQKNRDAFGMFLDSILQRVDKERFYILLDDILTYSNTNDEIYSELKRRIDEILPSNLSTASRIYYSLVDIKNDLSQQVQDLFDSSSIEKIKINGLLEIGYPGRFIRPLKNKFDISGQISILNDSQSITDYIQSGFPRPYDQFLPMNDYAPIPSSVLKDNSLDMVTCFIGLHHIPEDKIDNFLQSVRRVLRPGGSFMLVDHDITDNNTLDLANLAHSTYNAVMGASEMEEKNEIRNFRPLQYWSEKLDMHDLGKIAASNKPMIRKDDPTKNTMLRFTNNKVLEPKLLKAIELERAELIKNKHNTLLNKLLGNLNNVKLPIYLSLLVGGVLKLGQVLQVGITRALTTSSIGLASAFTFMLASLIMRVRNQFSKNQYQEYKNKSDCDFKKLNEIQREAFNLGDNASKSYTVQASSFLSKQAYIAPKAYYAGFEAGLNNDTELKRKLNTL